MCPHCGSLDIEFLGKGLWRCHDCERDFRFRADLSGRCPYCGGRVDDAGFCTQCGARV